MTDRVIDPPWVEDFEAPTIETGGRLTSLTVETTPCRAPLRKADGWKLDGLAGNRTRRYSCADVKLSSTLNDRRA